MRNIGPEQTVIFLDYFETPEEIAPIIKKVRAGLRHDPVVVSSGFDTEALSRSIGLKAVYFDDMLDASDYRLMDSYVYNMAQNWHLRLKSAEGLTEYRGVKFGEAAEERSQRLFTSVIKNVEIIFRIKDALRPDEIIMIGEEYIFNGFSEFIRKELGIRARFIRVRPERRGLLTEARRMVAETASSICDLIVKKIMLAKKTHGDILIDARLYAGLKDGIDRLCRPRLYLLERGLRVRIDLIGKGMLYMPVLSDSGVWDILKRNPLRRYWNSARSDASFRDKFVYRGARIWNALEKILEELVVTDFNVIRKNALFLERAYKALRPKIVVLREAVRGSEKTMVLTARQAGIPTLAVQHGILAERYVYTKLFCDKIALWGEAGIGWYGSRGNDTSRCVVTGKPAHDRLYPRPKRGEDAAGEVLRRYGLDNGKDTVLYVPSYFKEAKRLLSVYYPCDSEYISMDAILKAMSAFPDKQLIIKLHPFDGVDMKDFIDSKIKRRANTFVIKDADVISLMEASSLVIASLFSSAAMDAVILGKPLITLNIYRREDLVPFFDYGVALRATNSEELEKALRGISEDKDVRDMLASNRERFIKDYAYRMDGNSTGRVMDLIEEMRKDI